MNIVLVGFYITALLLAFTLFFSYRFMRRSQKKTGALVKELNEVKRDFDAKIKERTEHLEKSRDLMSDYAVQKTEYALELEARNHELISSHNELARQNDELKILYEQSRAQQENEQKLMRMVVHDLKNPINIILNATEAIEDPSPAIIKIRQVSMEMSEMVLNILDLGKFEQNAFNIHSGQFDLSGSITSVSEKFTLLCREKSIELRTDLPGSCNVIADIRLTERIIENLLSNAIRFTPPLGCITVSATIPGNMARIEVSDNGSGINRKILDQAFDEYIHDDSRAFAYSNSTGIGLSFCRQAVEALGGKIGIISNEGEGTRVWFTLKKGEEMLPVTQQRTKSRITPEKLIEDDIRLIKSYIAELIELEISEISSVLKVLRNEVFSSNERILFWKESVESAVFSGNAELYRSLIAITG